MARPKKQTIDYFPHSCTHGKTMFIIEQKYGNDGYAFWFKLLELLGGTAGHYIDLNDEATQEFLQAKTRISWDLCHEILDLLAKLDAIDAELWEHKIVWCQNFVDGISDVYKNRRTEIPSRPSFYIEKPHDADISTGENPKSKVKESKVEESKEEESNISTDDNYNSNNPFRYYQQNIGPLLPDIADLIDQYRKDLPDELITEAFKLAVKNNARSMRYAEKIMISWMDKGIRTMEDYRRHEAEWEHRKTAEAGREEAPAKRQYTQAEIEAAARYIKRAVSRYEGSNVLEFIYSLGYPQEVADGAVKLLRERKELVV